MAQQPLYYEVCRWIESEDEPRYSQEIISCGKRAQVITTVDTLEQAQKHHANLATCCGTKPDNKKYFINAGKAPAIDWSDFDHKYANVI